MKGVAGVQVMAYRCEHLVEEIVSESGILRERLAAQATVETELATAGGG